MASEGTAEAASSSSSTVDPGTATAPTGTSTGSVTPTEASTTSTSAGGSTSTGEASATTENASATTGATSTGEPADTSTGEPADTSTGEPADTSTGAALPDAPVLKLTFSQTKQFNFAWEPAAGAEFYQLWEKPTGAAPYQQIPDMQEIVDTSISLTMPLHLRWEARYQLMACNADGCTPSAEVEVIDSLAALTGAVGYFKAPNSGAGDGFGYSVALSADGNTLAVGAPNEDGSGKGVEPLDNNAANNAGAVYVFVRVAENVWQKQAYLKGTQSETFDQFGLSIALSADGNVLAVGAPLEDAQANTITNSGAVYMFVRSADVWKTSSYLKASNPGVGDSFGRYVALSGDGNTLAVGAYFEDSSDIGINGKKNDDAAPDSGAAYVFTWVNPSWVQQAYIKSSNSASLDRFGQPVALSADGDTLAVGAPFKDTEAGAAFVFVRDGDLWTEESQLKAKNAGAGDHFGLSVSISADGDTLAVGANQEDSPGTDINGPEGDSMITENAGAAYVYERTNKQWTQTTYIKASNTGANDYFGLNLALSDDGSTLAITARDEDGGATGIGGSQGSNTHANAGAVFVFERALDTWAQRAYVKASNTGAGDRYGLGLALSGDGRLLVVGADLEDSNAKGINKDQANNGAVDAGAVYVY